MPLGQPRAMEAMVDHRVARDQQRAIECHPTNQGHKPIKWHWPIRSGVGHRVARDQGLCPSVTGPGWVTEGNGAVACRLAAMPVPSSHRCPIMAVLRGACRLPTAVVASTYLPRMLLLHGVCRLVLLYGTYRPPLLQHAACRLPSCWTPTCAILLGPQACSNVTENARPL